VVTGVLTKDSIAAAVARLAQEQGAELVLTSFGRGMRLTERVARTLPVTTDVVELDVTDPAQHDALAEVLRARWGTVDGALHAGGFASEACLGQDDGLLSAGWDDVATALHVSTYSLKSLAQTVLPLMPRGGSIIGLDYDAAQAWRAECPGGRGLDPRRCLPTWVIAAPLARATSGWAIRERPPGGDHDSAMLPRGHGRPSRVAGATTNP
jgi:hypothetical protein